MNAATIVTEVAAIEDEANNAATSAVVAAVAAEQAVAAAVILTEQVEQASQAAAVAIVDEVHANTEQMEWNKERLDRMETTLTETRAMVAPLMATLETLVASVALMGNSSSSVASPLPAPVTPSPAKSDGADLLAAGTPEVVPPEALEPKPESPARKEKRFRLMR